MDSSSSGPHLVKVPHGALSSRESESTQKLEKKTPASSDDEKKGGSMSRLLAARIIQRFWRRHIDVQVYKYYRDLINFRNRGDPAMMLRCINPVEAKLLDGAAGVHIKFRLAGERFPPNIYYKIFTHRAIQDICANAPRDYTSADSKCLDIRDVHNKNHRNTNRKEKDRDTHKEGWYKRTENNGWRLVSDRLLHHAMSDPVTWTTSKQQIHFHHNKLQRQEDLEKKRKQKKIDWMKKMYRDGMLQAKATDTDTIALIEGATTGMVAAINQHGADAVQEWEVDELLEWTTNLNYDEYVSEWKEIATSANSETVVEERTTLKTGSADPYEMTVVRGRYSHNTPVSRLSQSEPSVTEHTEVNKPEVVGT